MKLMHEPIDERMYRLLACDYDGTLTESNELSPSIKSMLRGVRANGIRVALITGRLFDELLELCPQINLFDLVVAENGALMFQPNNGKLLAFGKPPPDSLTEALTVCRDSVPGRPRDMRHTQNRLPSSAGSDNPSGAGFSSRSEQGCRNDCSHGNR